MNIILLRYHSVHSAADGSYPKAENLHPPLGLVCLATMLKNHGCDVEILDFKALNLTLSQSRKALLLHRPDVIGITTYSVNLPGTMEIAALCKELFPEALRIVGGPHMAVDPESVMRRGLFDVGVIGEGEYTLLEIVQAFAQAKEIPTDIVGTMVFDNGRIVRNAARPRIQDLEALPIPDRSCLDNSLYGPNLAQKPFTYLLTSRGCPYDCAFCYKKVWGKQTTFVSAERVFEEIKKCAQQQHIREIWIWDETFTLKRQRVIDLCNLLLANKISVRWKAMTRVNLVDEELLRLMKKAGCYKVEFGVESGTQKILDIMKKGITLNQVRTAFSLAKKCGLQTHAFFMIGYPHETRDTIAATIRLAQEITDWASFNAVSVFPGTDLYDLAVQDGYFSPRMVDFFSGQSTHENFCNSTTLSSSEIIFLTSQAYRKFYLRPLHIFRLLFLLIRDRQLLDFLKIMRYSLVRLFGRYNRVHK